MRDGGTAGQKGSRAMSWICSNVFCCIPLSSVPKVCTSAATHVLAVKVGPVGQEYASPSNMYAKATLEIRRLIAPSDWSSHPARSPLSYFPSILLAGAPYVPYSQDSFFTYPLLFDVQACLLRSFTWVVPMQHACKKFVYIDIVKKLLRTYF
jgi:hypothetical protein